MALLEALYQILRNCRFFFICILALLTLYLQGTFTFRVLTRCTAKLRSVDVTPAIIKSAIVKAPAALADAKVEKKSDVLMSS